MELLIPEALKYVTMDRFQEISQFYLHIRTRLSLHIFERDNTAVSSALYRAQAR